MKFPSRIVLSFRLGRGAGCASTKVTERQQLETGKIPRPESHSRV